MAVIVSFLGKWDGKDIERGIKQMRQMQQASGDTGKSFTQSFKDIAAKAAVAGAAIAGVGVVVNKAIQAASDLAESQSKVSVVFAENADEVLAWAKNSAVAFGQTEQQALEAAGTYGNLFQAFGLTRDAATEMSKTMVELAADLASFNNTSIDDAIEALRSGLSGETEPLKRFGIALNDTRMKAEAMALGIYEGTGTLNAAQKAQAAYAVIMRDTTLAQGDFARTSTGLANQQRILEAQFGNLVAQLGSALLPIALKVVGTLNTFMGALKGVGDFVSANSTLIKALALTVGIFATAIIATNAATIAAMISNVAYSATLTGMIVLLRAAHAANLLLAAAMKALPFVGVITVATALVVKFMDINEAAQASTRAMLDNAKAANKLRDETGKLTDAGRAYYASQRSTARGHVAQRDAMSGTVSAAITYGNAMNTVIDKTEEVQEAAKGAAKSVYDLQLALVNQRRMERDIATTSGTVSAAIAEGLEKGYDLTEAKLKEIRESLEETGKSGKKAGKDIKDGLDKLTDKQKTRLDALKELAQTAKESFTEIRDSIYGTMSGWLNIGNAAEAYAARQKAVTDTLAALEEARSKMTADSTDQQKAELQELADAHERAKAAAKSGAQSIVDEFVEQSKKFGEFGEKMRKLLAAGLNKTTFKQIFEMGAERGSDVADSYLNGNTAELIRQTNETVAEYDKLSQAIANESAKAFYQAGLQSAIALLKAFSATLGKNGAARKELKALIKDLESELTINISTNVATPTGGTQSFAPASTGAGDLYTAPDLAAVAQAFPQFTPSASGGGNTIQIGGVFFTPFAEGGLVKGPTLGLVGEAGPELIVPLDRLGSMGGETNINLTVNAGMGTNGAEVGRQIVDALKQYNRRNGPIPVSVNG